MCHPTGIEAIFFVVVVFGRESFVHFVFVVLFFKLKQVRVRKAIGKTLPENDPREYQEKLRKQRKPKE